MTITYSSMSSYLPAGSVEFVGDSQVKLNFNRVTGDSLTLDSGFMKGFIKLLDSLAKATIEINKARVSQDPPLAPIAFVTKTLGGTPEIPIVEFNVAVSIDQSQFLNNLIDPT